jgi:tetratricopeptide (TPR) repeat protein
MITLRGLSRIALYLTFVFAFALPALPQGNEAKDWQAVQDQKDQKKKADGMEAFIKKYPTSTRRPVADGDLVDLWLKNNDTAKIVPFAEEYKKAPPSPDAAAKAKIYSQAALVAYTGGNVEKAAGFGEAAIEADPTHYQSLSFLARAGLPNPEKAFEYALRALAQKKPENIAPDVYNKQIASLHGIVALPLFAQRKYADAREHIEFMLKDNPKNQEAQYRHGFASVNLMGEAVKTAQDANTAMLKAAAASNKAEQDAAMAKQESAQRQALELRDAALDSLAKAVAIGGPYTEQAEPLFKSLYQNKNKSMEGADKLIADKKVELGL